MPNDIVPREHFRVVCFRCFAENTTPRDIFESWSLRNVALSHPRFGLAGSKCALPPNHATVSHMNHPLFSQNGSQFLIYQRSDYRRAGRVLGYIGGFALALGLGAFLAIDGNIGELIGMMSGACGAVACLTGGLFGLLGRHTTNINEHRQTIRLPDGETFSYSDIVAVLVLLGHFRVDCGCTKRSLCGLRPRSLGQRTSSTPWSVAVGALA